jgi:hypothetical protein
MAASSALLSVPSNEMIPAISHTPSNTSGEPTCAAITPGLRKIPGPINSARHHHDSAEKAQSWNKSGRVRLAHRA